VIYFWYRQSPRYLEPYNKFEVTAGDPPRTISGMTGLLLDTQGRLVSFYGVPPQIDETPGSSAPPDWSVLFHAAELDSNGLKPTESKWVPAHPYDRRVAWEGAYPHQPDIPIRIEAAAYHGRPVYFEIIYPWNKPFRQEQFQPTTNIKIVQAVFTVLFVMVLLGGVLLARRNLRLGRGDRKGAFRLAFFVLAVHMLAWVFLVHHVPTLVGEISLFGEALAWSLLIACFLWLVYIALEPLVRQRWPERIIAWSRLLAGEFRDPLVGRDILIGALFGVVFILTTYLKGMLPPWLGLPPGPPKIISLHSLLGFGSVVGLLAEQVVSSLIYPSIALLLLLLLALILRKEWLAIGGVWLLLTLFDALTGKNPSTDWLIGGVNAALLLLLLMRYGLFAMIVAEFFFLLIIFYPMTSDFSAWYAGGTFFALGLSAALAVYGFYRSLAGQPLFRGGFLQD
jgi:serine/threonine-protein kinase